MSLRAQGAVTTGALTSTTGGVKVEANGVGGNVNVGAINAAGLADLFGQSVNFTTIDAGSAQITSVDPLGTGIVGTRITTSGNINLNQQNGSTSPIVGVTTLTTTAGSLSIQSVGAVNLGTVSVTGGTTSITGQVAGNPNDVTIANTLTSSGTVTIGSSRDIIANTITSTGGGVTLNTLAASGQAVRGVGAANMDISASGPINVRAGTLARLGVLTGNGVDVTAPTISATSVNAGAGLASLVAGAGGLIVNGAVNGGPVTLTSLAQTTLNDAVTGSGLVTVSGTTGVGFTTIAGGSTTIGGGAIVGTGGNSATGASNLTINSASANIATIGSGSGNVAVTTSGAATFGTASAVSGMNIQSGGDLSLGSVSVTGGNAVLRSTAGAATLQTGTTAGSLSLTAATAATIPGVITAGNAYTVRGGTVALGVDADAELQQAAGVIDITSTTGAIVGGPGLTLRSDSNANNTGDAIILDSAQGISFTGDEIQAGPAGTAFMGVRAGSGFAVDLGPVLRVGSFFGINPAHTTFLTPFTHDANFTVGTVIANNFQVALSAGNIQTGSVTTTGTTLLQTAGSGTITTGNITAGTLTVNAGGALNAATRTYSTSGTATAGGSSITLDQLISTGGAANATATNGLLSINTVSAATGATLLATGPGNIVLTSATTTAGQLQVAASNGNVQADTLTSGSGNLIATASGSIGGRTTATPTYQGQTSAAITAGGTVIAGTVRAATGALSVSGSALTLGTAGAGTTMALTATTGGIGLTTGTSGGTANLTAVGPLTVTTSLIAGGNATLSASGASTTGLVRSTAGSVSITGQSVTATTVNAATTLGLTGSAGPVALGTGTSGGASTIAATGGTGAITLGSLTSGGATTLTAGSTITGTTVAATGALLTTSPGATSITTASGSSVDATGSSLAIGTATSGSTLNLRSTGGALSLGTGSATGAATLNAAGPLSITTSLTSGGNATLTSTDAITAASLRSTGGSVTATGLSVNATNATAATALALNATGGSTTVGTGVAGTTADLKATGGVTVTTSLTSTGAATIDAGGVATLAQVTAGPTLRITATDAAITGTQKATTVTFVNRTPATTALRLGDGTTADGFRLSTAEVGLVDATRAVFDGGTGAVQIGTLPFVAATGRTNVDVLTTGALSVTGTVTGSGAGRTFRLGGSGTDATALASTIQVVSTDVAGGRLLFDTANLDLRGGRIAVGLTSFLTPLFAGAGLSATEVAAQFVSNPGSSLYNSLAGGVLYSPAAPTLVSANTLSVRYGTYALVQNTAQLGFQSGAVLGGTTTTPVLGALTLSGPGATTPNSFALFGSINGVGSTATAVLGSTILVYTGIDVINSRVNGCIIGSGSGCISTTITRPSLNVFDASRIDIFRSVDNFSVPFDPIIGSNNEALFAGVAAIDVPVAPVECDAGNTSAQCNVPQEKRP